MKYIEGYKVFDEDFERIMELLVESIWMNIMGTLE